MLIAGVAGTCYAGGMSNEIEKDLVCVLPEGFELTESRYDVILAAWHRKGDILDEDEVLALFSAGPSV